MDRAYFCRSTVPTTRKRFLTLWRMQHDTSAKIPTNIRAIPSRVTLQIRAALDP